uniref:Uncharacterized protein n=1 Tax=Physcomitrium patens TaxID=3218 RepID=A0A2K1KXC1_PHYPA|nr:hypothetical protein PHYPA_005395 [Physcomitrium patens]
MILSKNDTPLEAKVKEGYKEDEEAIELNKIFDYKPVLKKGLSSKFSRLKIVKKVNGLIYYKQSRLYLPKRNLRKKMMREVYDILGAGHRRV